MDRETIQRIVKASGVTAGELILIHFWGEDAERAIANDFAIAVSALGATPVVLQEARSVNRDMFQAATQTSFGERFFSLYAGCDAVLDVFAYQPVVLGYELEAEQMEHYRRYMARLFSALMGCRRFTQIRMPTRANAGESGLEPEAFIRRMTDAYQVDYDLLQDKCMQAIQSFQGRDRLVLRTGEECALAFDLTGRQWHADAGDGDWPCGEIYIAPNEAGTNGTVFFETLYLEDAGKYRDVKLDIKDGKVVGSSHPAVTAYLRQLPAGGSVVCELGLGMNPKVTDLCGYPVLDEKMAGSFHIALGANTMFGGQNEAPMHIDLVGAESFSLLPPA